MNELQKTIQKALVKKAFYNLTFVTVWLTNNKHYGFNFDEKELGHVECSYGDKREVVGVY